MYWEKERVLTVFKSSACILKEREGVDRLQQKCWITERKRGWRSAYILWDGEAFVRLEKGCWSSSKVVLISWEKQRALIVFNRSACVFREREGADRLQTKCLCTERQRGRWSSSAEVPEYWETGCWSSLTEVLEYWETERVLIVFNRSVWILRDREGDDRLRQKCSCPGGKQIEAA